MDSVVFLAEENQEVVRSDIWHEDGTLVFQARMTQSSVAVFCPSIRASFAVPPQGALDIPRVEGRPLVHLSDSAYDIKVLLETLYDTISSGSHIQYAFMA